MINRLKGWGLVIAGLLGCSAANADDWAQFQKYEESNKELESGDTKPVAVFMGNSLTEGWMATHPEFFSSNNFVGRGISGQTTYQMLLRFRDDVINLHPEKVVILGGTNDIAENNHIYNEDRTLGNIISMVELAQANGIQPVLSSLLPATRFFWREDMTDIDGKIQSLNKRIKAYADEKGIPYVDYYTVMVNDKGGLTEEYTIDGCHPTPQGYDVMESVVLPFLK